MAKKVRKGKRKKTAEATKRKRSRQLTPEEQNILREAMCYCLHHFPMLWTTGGLPEECGADDGCRRWIIAVYLRYPTGHEGYLGDLGYDGKQFTELTDRKVMEERAKQIADDPERLRKWNEYRASTLPSAEG